MDSLGFIVTWVDADHGMKFGCNTEGNTPRWNSADVFGSFIKLATCDTMTVEYGE